MAGVPYDGEWKHCESPRIGGLRHELLFTSQELSRICCRLALGCQHRPCLYRRNVREVFVPCSKVPIQLDGFAVSSGPFEALAEDEWADGVARAEVPSPDGDLARRVALICRE